MSSENFNLTWNNFERCAINTFKDLRSELEFVNVTLVSEDNQEMKAHKVVLSACSPVLKNILLKNPHQHPLIYLTGVKHQELKSLVDFMYLGQAEVSQTNLEIFMSLGSKFEIKGLCEENKSQYQGDTIIKDERENGNYIEDHLISQEGASSYTHEIVQKDVTPEINYGQDEEDFLDVTSDAYRLHSEFKCDQCDYVAKKKSHLDSHTKARHEGIKFPCNMCDYKAGYNHHLNKHKRYKHGV